MSHRISRAELFQAQAALVIAIGLQIVTRHIGSVNLPGSQDLLILTEMIMVLLMAFTINMERAHQLGIHHAVSIVLAAVITAANLSGLIYVLKALVTGHGVVNGEKLLASSIAIFLTNIIIYALWYWEIDSPGLTRTHWSKHHKDFHFTQQERPQEYLGWRPQFGDYLYLSITNAVTFGPGDVWPVSLQAKMLMASQSLVSVFVLALLIARSVSILS